MIKQYEEYKDIFVNMVGEECDECGYKRVKYIEIFGMKFYPETLIAKCDHNLEWNEKEKENMTIDQVLFSSPCKEHGLCRNRNCETAVAEYRKTGRWYITFGHAGYNSKQNNAQGYVSKDAAMRAMRKFMG